MVSLIAGFAMIAFVVGMLISNATAVENGAAHRALAENLVVQHRAANEWVMRNAVTNGNIPDRLNGQVTNMADWRSRVMSAGDAVYIVTWSGANSQWEQEDLRRAVALIDPGQIASLPRSGVGLVDNARIGPVTVAGVALPVQNGDVAAVSVLAEDGEG